MGFRFRLGPFTFGRAGIRFSLWGRGGGLSIPLSGKGRSFGRIGFGPLSWFFRGSSSAHADEAGVEEKQHLLESYESSAIKAFQSDQKILGNLRQYGVPWRGVQERLKEELPDRLSNRDEIAYNLVPKAMDVIFGRQDKEWKTEKRPSKSDSGYTTWIVIIQ
jgi:hypothetical protein